MANVTKAPAQWPGQHLLALMRRPPWDVLREWSQANEYKPFRFHFFNETYVVLAEPDQVQHVLQTNFRQYAKDLHGYAPFLVLLGTGLVTSEGELWRHQRSLISAVFKVGILQEAGEISYQAGMRLVRKLAALPRGAEVEIGEEFRHATLQVIGEAVLSLAPEKSDAVFPRLYLPIVEEANYRVWHPYRKFLPFLPAVREYNEAVRELDAFVTDTIERRHDELMREDNAGVLDRVRQRVVDQMHQPGNDDSTGTAVSCDGDDAKKEGRKVDILDRILAGKSGSEWSRSTVDQLRDEIKTFLFAGHETSSMMLTWALFELISNPRCLAKLKKEVESVFTDPDRMPAYDDIQRKLVYTEWVLRETLRLHTVVPIVTRECVRDDKIGDMHVPKGARVVLHMQAIHRRADVWEDPNTFRPERFEHKHHPYAWLPFINGPRACIGQHFARLEAKIILALLVTRFTFALAPGEHGQHHPYNIPIAPLHRMRVIVD
eukprot:TRINITY_DN68879_c0_g1_i1.p1 TRINITY_DN68879_c0_g1~~TRINITY_DN68879_c0_g1_i1.p1  ORF type:complete len:531 (-),score=261.24 TRINITY_DN68879_c0_g1_i1:41-1507(-)